MAIEDLKSKADLERFELEVLEKNPLPQDSVDGLPLALSGGNWQPLALTEGWTFYASPYSEPAWRTLPGGLIQLRGLVKKEPAIEIDTIANLPAGARPKQQKVYACVDFLAGFARVDVRPGGEVARFAAAGTTFVSLDGIIFMVNG